MTAPRWPIAALPAQNIAVNPEFRNARGAAGTAYGRSQIAASDAGRWSITLGSIVIRDGAGRKAWRALQAIMEGGLTPICIPLCRADQPIPAGGAQHYGSVPHSDGAYFSDGSGYAQQVIDVTATTGAARGATQLTLTKTYAADLEPPHFFSFGEQLYQIKAIVGEQEATAATVRIWPPLREAVAAGAHAEFDNPICRVRLAGDAGMDLELEQRRAARPTVRFVEDLF